MSTAEVADVLTFLDCIQEAAVYGVQVPGRRPLGEPHSPQIALQPIRNMSDFASRQANDSFHI